MHGTAASRNLARRTGRTPKARSLACRECRDRKVRCDGARPVCDSCARRGLGTEQCRYPEMENEGSISSSRSHILALQRRIQQLEAERDEAVSHRYASPQSHASSSGIPPSAGEGWPGASEVKRHPSPHSSPRASTQSALPHHPYGDPMRADCIGNLGFSSFNAHGAFLNSNNGSSAVAGASPPLTDDMDDAAAGLDQFHHKSSSSHSQVLYNLGRISLPPTEIMDELLQRYFDYDWILMPFVHRLSFIQRYHRLLHVCRTRESSTRDISADLVATYCLLFGMLALGQISKADIDSPASADGSHFHEQVRALLVLDLISKPSIIAVQALLLHARFLRQRGSLNESWVLSGLARQVATRIKFNLNVPIQSQAEREERRRTWCACASMARTHGSPEDTSSASSPPSYGTLPQEIDDEYLEEGPSSLDKTQPSDMPSLISFFVHSLKLSDKIQATRAFYFDDEATSLSDILATTSRLDCELQEWRSGLPSHLQDGFEQPSKSFRLSRQAALMRIQYLEAKAFLYRGSITKLIKGHLSPERATMSALTKSIILGVLDSNLSTASELIDVLGCEDHYFSKTHSITSLCIIGISLGMLQRQPILTTSALNPTAYGKEIARCLSVANHHTGHSNPLIHKYMSKFRAVAGHETQTGQGLIDPSLDPSRSHTRASAVSPPFYHSTIKSDIESCPEVKALDSWYKEDVWAYG